MNEDSLVAYLCIERRQECLRFGTGDGQRQLRDSFFEIIHNLLLQVFVIARIPPPGPRAPDNQHRHPRLHRDQASPASHPARAVSAAPSPAADID